jgi:GNAT superfamily N-acetyltransferase
MAEISYRAATLDDLETLAALRWEMQIEGDSDLVEAAGRETYIATYCAEMRAEMQRGRLCAWIAEAESQPVASVSLIWWVVPPTIQHPRRRRGQVSNVYTRPAYRRQGISRQLMLLLLEHAHAQGIQRLVLWASEMGAPLYASLGFAPSGAMERNF